MHPRTCILLIVTASLFAGLNLVSRPGVGPRMPPKPPGFELERYFGWPATYRAELWESDDEGMAKRDKASYRVYDPSKEMTAVTRAFSLAAVAFDFLVFAAILLMTATANEARRRPERRRREVVIVFACFSLFVTLYLLADRASVSL